MIKTGGEKDFAWGKELAEKGITLETMLGSPIPFSEKDRDHDFFVLVSEIRQKRGKPFENQSEVSSFCQRCSGAIESILKGEIPPLGENGENPLAEVRNLFNSVFRQSLREAAEDIDRLPR